MLKKIDSSLINKIILDSKTAIRRRARNNFHQNNEKLQRMVVAFQKDAYIQPHKHQNPDKLEVFICLKGRFLAICFDTSGAIIDHTVFGEKEKIRGIEVSPRLYHTFWPLEDNSVIYEVIEGPYDSKTHKKFAAWAPSEEEREKSLEYMDMVKKKLKIIV